MLLRNYDMCHIPFFFPRFQPFEDLSLYNALFFLLGLEECGGQYSKRLFYSLELNGMIPLIGIGIGIMLSFFFFSFLFELIWLDYL
jgi:hypothetical protein